MGVSHVRWICPFSCNGCGGTHTELCVAVTARKPHSKKAEKAERYEHPQYIHTILLEPGKLDVLVRLCLRLHGEGKLKSPKSRILCARDEHENETTGYPEADCRHAIIARLLPSRAIGQTGYYPAR